MGRDGHVPLAGLLEPGAGVLRDRLQQPEPRPGRSATGTSEGLDGAPPAGARPGRLDGPGAGRHRLEVVEAEAAHEHRQQPQQRLLGRCRAGRGSSRGWRACVRCRAGRSRGPLEQRRCRVGRAGPPGRAPARGRPPARGRAGMPGEADADRAPRPRRRPGRSPSPGLHRAGAVQQEPAARASRPSRCPPTAAERLDDELGLAAHAQRRPAGGQHREARRGLDQRGDLRRRVQEVLDVVQDQQQLLVAQAVDDVVGDQVPPGATGRLDGVGDGRQHRPRVEQRRQLDEDVTPSAYRSRCDGRRPPARAGSCRPRRCR